jgi:2-oxoglutarate dehydrogenase E1 component
LILGYDAVVGQVVVPETLKLCQLRGFATGGSVLLVINNQDGFTISEPKDARSGRYTTDVAKFIDAPVFHVNEDDPEACVYAMQLAFDYRNAFHKDSFVDLVCYRRHGHNEGDEPAAEYATLKHLSDKQGRLEIYDSSLSELAVLGFEYGYAATEPNSLVIWEAQFGDFANGAQAMIDQYISSGEVKWRRLSGVVMMLPHGYEGQGPEHSSARLERYLQLCAEENMQVVVPSTPAQIFHLLRRQMVRKYRKPLVILTPKSLLRHKQAVSSLEELAGGRFQNVIPDATVSARADRVILCAGKVYYELAEARAKHNLQNLAIVRVEQLHPFPTEDVRAELAKHPGAQVVWAQEEPKNQGAWYFVQEELRPLLASGQTLSVSSRPASASPATGYPSKHVEQQQSLINIAVGLPTAVEERVVRDPQFTG